MVEVGGAPVARWDPERYLQFADARARPFVDLMRQVPAVEAASVLDLGCGPGQLTPIIRATFPEAEVVGVDSSPEMIQQARRDDPDTRYEVADVLTWRPDEPVDAIVSNALFQWIDGRADVISDLARSVRPGGVFAIQTPSMRGTDAASHRLLLEMASSRPYGEHTAEALGLYFNDPFEDYVSLFADLGWSVNGWSTTYAHVLDGDDPVFAWVSGTGARPVLAALPDDLRERFTAEYKAALREAYPRRPWGTVFPFTRTFCVARRPID